jgi:aryl-alcohol dehydrogenase-like predicted oxidoreductase
VPIENINQILETLLSFKDAGYTKMIGIGGNPSKSFEPYIDKKYFQVISSFTKMDACNLSAFEDILPKTILQHIKFYAASSLHFGLLGNRFDHFVAEGNSGYKEYISKKDIETSVLVNEYAAKNRMTLPELAQRYLFSIEEASRVVMGARKLRELTDTISCWKKGALPKTQFDKITQIILKD